MKKLPIDVLVDMLGDAKAETARVTAIEAGLREQLLERVKPGEAVEGDRFRAAVVRQMQERLDVDAIRSSMKPAWLKKFTFRKVVVRVAVVARVRDQV